MTLLNILLVVQIIVVVCLIGVILMQRSAADGLTGGGGGDGFMSGRGAANALTRMTAILATLFIVNSLVLAYLSSHTQQKSSIVGDSDPVKTEATTTEGATPAVDETPKAPEPALPDNLPNAVPEAAITPDGAELTTPSEEATGTKKSTPITPDVPLP